MASIQSPQKNYNIMMSESKLNASGNIYQQQALLNVIQDERQNEIDST